MKCNDLYTVAGLGLRQNLLHILPSLLGGLVQSMRLQRGKSLTAFGRPQHFGSFFWSPGPCSADKHEPASLAECVFGPTPGGQCLLLCLFRRLSPLLLPRSYCQLSLHFASTTRSMDEVLTSVSETARRRPNHVLASGKSLWSLDRLRSTRG